MRSKQVRQDGWCCVPAQALVEFALASTLIFFLLAAAVDLGLIFFTMQGLRTAAQEGATFGSYPVVVYRNGGNDVFAPVSPASMASLSYNRIDLNYPEIIQRVYSSGGTGGVSGFANFRDLDNNGQDDMAQSLHQDYTTPSAFIRIENIRNSVPPAAGQNYPKCVGNEAGVDLQNGGMDCYIRVTVSYNYRFLFPLAPAFGSKVRISSSQVMPIRSPFYTN